MLINCGTHAEAFRPTGALWAPRRGAESHQPTLRERSTKQKTSIQLTRLRKPSPLTPTTNPSPPRKNPRPIKSPVPATSPTSVPFPSPTSSPQTSLPTSVLFHARHAPSPAIPPCSSVPNSSPNRKPKNDVPQPIHRLPDGRLHPLAGAARPDDVEGRDRGGGGWGCVMSGVGWRRAGCRGRSSLFLYASVPIRLGGRGSHGGHTAFCARRKEGCC